MKKHVWKIALIAFIIVWSIVQLRPHWDPESKSIKLNIKPGLDIAGGTSLIYEIDTADLKPVEVKGLATNMIPILMKRIDPGNVANVMMRPQGDRRIEIQLPLASADTLKRRKAYEEALGELEVFNINLLRIKRALGDEPAKREEFFAQVAGGSTERKAILDELARTYDARREKQTQRNAATAKMAELVTALDAAKLQGSYVKAMASAWSNYDDAKKAEELRKHVERICKEDQELSADAAKLEEAIQKGVDLIGQYLQSYKSWADAVNEITKPVTGRDDQWEAAVAKLGELNLSVEQVTAILDMPVRSVDRREALAKIKERFADRKDKIEAAEKAYASYKSVGGRLDDPEDLKRMLKGAGVLEFRILPTEGDSTGKTNQTEIAGYLDALKSKGPKAASVGGYAWCEIENINEFKQVPGCIVGQFGSKFYVLCSNKSGETMLRSHNKPWKLTGSRPSTDDMGRRAIAFSFDPIAANLFYDLTKNNRGRPLAILLDGLVLSAPNIEEAIGSSGIIRGEFTDTEVKDMVNKLNAGSFPARLSDMPISEKTIGATIGADNRDRSILAGIIGLTCTAVFMIFYYQLGGIIAVIALALNFLFILSTMAMSRSTFTLSGIAGLLLTVGMSVDANVLIFERIREEQERGSTVRMAIANGYSRAFWTIFDSNLTTFFSGLILYLVASEELKGFAIVLMIGLAWSMFTALFVTRVILDVLLDTRILRSHLRMFKAFSKPTINWMAMRPAFFLFSAACIIAGITVFILRDDTKNNKYDIEFTGGTSVQIDLKPGTAYDRAKVETAIQTIGEKTGNKALASVSVYQIGDTGLQYEITTTATNRTSATITFPASAPPQTLESIQSAIETATADTADRLYGLQIESTDNKTFTISTGQVNEAMLKRVLVAAFGRPMATLTLTDGGNHTHASIEETITKALETDKEQKEQLDGLQVTGSNPNFVVSVNPGSDALLKQVLEKTFGQQVTKIVEPAVVSEPVVDPIVTNAIRQAFKDDLAQREDIGLTMAAPVKIGDQEVELADYIGGVKIACTLDKASTGAEIDRRIKDIRLKQDTQHIAWYPFTLFKSDLTPLAATDSVKEFIFVSSLPEAGYREISESDWMRFVENEQARLNRSAQLETSLARITQIDPSIGRESVMRAWVAIVLMLIAILFYIWVRFGTAMFGGASVIAMIHDVLFTLGALVSCVYLANTVLGRALLVQDFKINLQAIAAFLTVLGYSLNDKIVVFDRIRENRGRLSSVTPFMLNDSINQTLSRTLLTGVTTLTVILVMYLWGGVGLRGFNFIMFIGIIIGTYSSIAIASPLLLIGQRKAELKR